MEGEVSLLGSSAPSNCSSTLTEEVVHGFIDEAPPASYWVKTHSRIYVILVRWISQKSIVSMLLEVEGGQNMLRLAEAGVRH